MIFADSRACEIVVSGVFVLISSVFIIVFSSVLPTYIISPWNWK